MQAGRGQTHDLVAHADAGTVHQLGVVHDAHAEAGQVVFAIAVHVGHLGGLAAQQGTGGLATAFGHAADDRVGGIHIQLAGGEVVKEEQGGGPLDQDVVDAHGHEVDAHGIVLVEGKGQFELGAHAVGGRNKHGVAHVADFRSEQAPESPDVGDDPLGMRALHQMLDARHEIIAGLDIDAGFGICFCAICGHEYPPWWETP